MKITITKTPLAGLLLVDIKPFQDERGFFLEPWHKRDFKEAGLDLEFVQEGHSQSRKRVLRGLHYQTPKAPMGKLVRATLGEVFEVAVDIRSTSQTFGRWFSLQLQAQTPRQLYVPPGFALGFQVLSPIAEIQYKQTGYYTPDAEGTIAWNDPSLAIAWPEKNPILSQRDQAGLTLTAYRELAKSQRW